MRDSFGRIVAHEVEVEFSFWLLDLPDHLHAEVLVKFDYDLNQPTALQTRYRKPGYLTPLGPSPESCIVLSMSVYNEAPSDFAHRVIELDIGVSMIFAGFEGLECSKQGRGTALQSSKE